MSLYISIYIEQKKRRRMSRNINSSAPVLAQTILQIGHRAKVVYTRATGAALSRARPIRRWLFTFISKIDVGLSDISRMRGARALVKREGFVVLAEWREREREREKGWRQRDVRPRR